MGMVVHLKNGAAITPVGATTICEAVSRDVVFLAHIAARDSRRDNQPDHEQEVSFEHKRMNHEI